MSVVQNVYAEDETTCDSGEYLSGSDCLDCPVGYACSDGIKTPCDPFSKQYTNTEGQSQCSVCNRKVVFSNDGKEADAIGVGCKQNCNDDEEFEIYTEGSVSKSFGCVAMQLTFVVNGEDLQGEGCLLYGLYAHKIRIQKNFFTDYCTICPVGYMCTNGTKQQCNASNGEYQDETGQSSCKTCENDTFLSETDGTCVACMDGGFYKEGSTCKTCPVGHMCTNGNKTQCNASNGEYQDETGKSTCKTCAAGSYIENNECNLCPEGYMCTGNGNKTQCNASNGEYQDETGKSTCKTCAAGNYIENNECKTCPVGYACTGGQKTECTDTEVNGSTVRYYQDTTGQTTCKTCAANNNVVVSGNVNVGCNIYGAGYCKVETRYELCSPGFSCPADGNGAARNCNDAFIVENSPKYGVAVCGAGTFTSSGGGASACEYCSTGYTTGCTDDSCTCYDKENGLGCVDASGNGNVCHKKVGKMCVGSNCDFSWPDGLIIGHIDLSRLKKRKSTSWSGSFPVFFGSFLANPISIGNGG